MLYCHLIPNFYPRSPCGERPNTQQGQQAQHDFYPRSPCGERPAELAGRLHAYRISIHALLAESDWAVGAAARPREVFLSTLSLRRATGCGLPQCHAGCDFYPRSPCGERRNNSNNELVCTVFLSTLSLRRATPAALPSKSATGFLSTLSLRRATISDTATSVGNWVFLSTLSLRRATTSLSWNRCARAFLSTLSLRRATDGRQPNVFLVDISIHALLAESDRGQDKHESRRVISIHALLAESDMPFFAIIQPDIVFLSTLSLRRATPQGCYMLS